MLPAVLLIGDSIRAGYQPFVAEALRGVAEVVSGADYGGTSAHIRANLDGWLRVRRYDLVHLNCGLHDLARRPGVEPNYRLLGGAVAGAVRDGARGSRRPAGR